MAGQAQKIANSDDLPQKPYKASFQDNKEKEKSSFYLFECAKITANNNMK